MNTLSLQKSNTMVYVYDGFDANSQVVKDAIEKYYKQYKNQVPSVAVYLNDDTPDSDRYEIGVIIFHSHKAAEFNLA